MYQPITVSTAMARRTLSSARNSWSPMPEHFTRARPAGILLENHDGKVVESGYAVDQVGFVLHPAAHAECIDRVRPLDRGRNGREKAP